MYTVKHDQLVHPKPNQIRLIQIVTDGATKAEWLAVARRATRDYRGAVSIFIYRDNAEIKYHGWHAHLTGSAGDLAINTDNDPDERRAIYEAFH